MRMVLTCIAMVGLFIAGTLFAVQPAIAVMVLAVCIVLAGILYAAAETHGFEGLYVEAKTPPYRWETLFLDVVRLAMKRDVPSGDEAVYVLLPSGITPITGIFSARVNGEIGIILDTSEPVAPDAHDFNRAKQGVM